MRALFSFSISFIFIWKGKIFELIRSYIINEFVFAWKILTIIWILQFTNNINNIHFCMLFPIFSCIIAFTLYHMVIYILNKLWNFNIPKLYFVYWLLMVNLLYNLGSKWYSWLEKLIFYKTQKMNPNVP